MFSTSMGTNSVFNMAFQERPRNAQAIYKDISTFSKLVAEWMTPGRGTSLKGHRINVASLSLTTVLILNKVLKALLPNENAIRDINDLPFSSSASHKPRRVQSVLGSSQFSGNNRHLTISYRSSSITLL